MRRKELASRDRELWRELARDCLEGQLAIVTPDGFPRSLAVNFAANDQALYFHGAQAGEKFNVLGKEPRCGFSMIQPLAFLPSTWSSPDNACPASQLYRSIEVKGRCAIVTDLAEKADGLQLLMDKYQPEGGFIPLSAREEMYRKMIAATGVFRIDVESWTGKIKVLQKDPAEQVRKIIAHLEERAQPGDDLTVALIRRYHPSL
jgi:nitroimidazol reductase NimA-like FMN-containing flavoprotein (pyridoxamine 5'-phosphate oxidase superfamily)